MIYVFVKELIEIQILFHINDLCLYQGLIDFVGSKPLISFM